MLEVISESNRCFETIWENILHQLVFDLCVLLLDWHALNY